MYTMSVVWLSAPAPPSFPASSCSPPSPPPPHLQPHVYDECGVALGPCAPKLPCEKLLPALPAVPRQEAGAGGHPAVCHGDA